MNSQENSNSKPFVCDSVISSGQPIDMSAQCIEIVETIAGTK